MFAVAGELLVYHPGLTVAARGILDCGGNISCYIYIKLHAETDVGTTDGRLRMIVVFVIEIREAEPEVEHDPSCGMSRMW